MTAVGAGERTPYLEILGEWVLGRRSLDSQVWQRRHNIVLGVLAAHIPGLFLLGALTGNVVLAHNLVDMIPLIVLTFLGWKLPGRRPRELAASLGMLMAAASVVHLGGGYVELHFHFFLALTIVSLYQSRTILAAAVTFTFLHHVIMGSLAPDLVWVNGANNDNPFIWAFIHAVYVAVASAAQLVFWRNTDDAKRMAEESYRSLWQGEQALVEELRSAERMKDELVATVSHEFRTPLTSVMGFGRLLQTAGDRINEADRRHYLDMIVSQSERLSRLVENLLVEAKEVEVNTGRATDAGALAAKAVAELSPIAASEQEEGARRFFVDAPDGAVARIDNDALHQIYVNLLTNAIKFSPALSPIHVIVRGTASKVEISVTNVTARKLTERDLQRVFEPFVQLDSSDRRPAPGIGLGLSIVRRLVAAHDGAVRAEFHEGEVTFSLTLPRVDIDLSEHERVLT